MTTETPKRYGWLGVGFGGLVPHVPLWGDAGRLIPRLGVVGRTLTSVKSLTGCVLLLSGATMKTMQVQAVADDEMPGGLEWAVVETDDGEVLMLVKASTTTRSPESQARLNAALRRAG